MARFQNMAERVPGLLFKVADAPKRLTEPILDHAILLTGVNAGGYLAATEAMQHADITQPTETAMLLGAGAALYKLNEKLLKKGDDGKRGIESITGKTNERSWAWMRTAVFGGLAALAVAGVAPSAKQLAYDVRTTFESPEIVKPPSEAPAPTRARAGNFRTPPEGFHDIGYTPVATADVSGFALADKKSRIGMVQRVQRFEPLYRAVEERYDLPANWLPAMGMQESYGDPMQPNATADGGLGFLHMQGKTAVEYGLRVHGTVRGYSDYQHGEDLNNLIDSCDEDAVCVQRSDERAHILKNLDAAARIIRQGMGTSGDVERGIGFFRGGSANARSTYIKRVREYKALLDSESFNRGVREDFERRNDKPYSTFLTEWHKESQNWGLPEYKRLP